MQRPIALRVARAYRTVPINVLFALAGTVPYKWVAKAWEGVYRITKEIRNSDYEVSKRIKEGIRNREMSWAKNQWRRELLKNRLRRKPVLNAILKN